MTKARPRTPEKSDRLTREIWVKEGLLALAEQGEPAVRVDVIAKKLNISRGSFYWHFEDRAAFLSAILEEWHRSSTTVIQEHLDRSGLPPVERIKLLLEASGKPDPLAPGGVVERALGQWARYDKEVAKMLAAVHKERLRFCESLLREMGHEKPDVMSEVLYSYIVGRNQLAAHISLSRPQGNITLEMFGVGIERFGLR